MNGKIAVDNETPARPSDKEIVSRFPMTTVMAGYCLWNKWALEKRPYTQTETGVLVGEILWQMMVSWVNEISSTHERREVTSEFISDVYAMATLEIDGYERETIKQAIEEGFKKKE